jgi:hypothetical protein
MSKFRIVASIVGLAFIGAFVVNPVEVGSKAATEPAPVAAKPCRDPCVRQRLGLCPGTVALRVPMADPDETGPRPRPTADLIVHSSSRIRAYLVSGFFVPAAFCAA